jgi:hypothetical protein
VTKTTGIEFDVYGFDTGAGMPSAIDYRDHPEHFQQGDFPMDHDRLAAALPPFAHLIIGDVAETVPPFLDRRSPDMPPAFVGLDLTFTAAGARSLPADVPQDPGWQTSPPTCYARPRRESAVVTQYERSDTC